MPLLPLHKLHTSDVVANSAMNRERGLDGVNSYRRELDINIFQFLAGTSPGSPITWVDLCCGAGRALIEAAAQFHRTSRVDNFRFLGIDLVGHFDHNPYPDVLTLARQSIEEWRPGEPYRLITCCHGLHYIGDKLGVLAKAVRHLSPTGMLVANLDLANFRFADGRPAGRTVVSRLRRAGLAYDARRRLVRCEGTRTPDFGLQYLGADDAAGPNYTGQGAVDSYYLR